MNRSHHHARHAPGAVVQPVDPKDPGAEFLQAEIDSDRRSERILIPKAIVALAFIAVIVVIRQVFFV
jgi:hypothetical protein